VADETKIQEKLDNLKKMKKQMFGQNMPAKDYLRKLETSKWVLK
jgi:hypothetical protein